MDGQQTGCQIKILLFKMSKSCNATSNALMFTVSFSSEDYCKVDFPGYIFEDPCQSYYILNILQ